MTEEEMESIARSVHEAWMEEKARQGYHYPGICNNIYMCFFCHPNIKDYSLLEEDTKEIDRATVRGVMRALKNNGYNVIKA